MPIGNVYVGTNFGHDSAAAAIDSSGELFFAAEEGKLVSQKACEAFPDQSLNILLEYVDASHCVTWGEGWNWPDRLVHKGILSTLRFGFRDSSYVRARLHKEVRRYLLGMKAEARWSDRLGPPSYVGHHRAHMLSLIPWGLRPNTLAVVSDTTGERESVSVLHWSGRSVTIVCRSFFPHSLGSVYHQAATHLGFRGREAPGKLMALSGYGEPLWRAELDRLVTVQQGKVIFPARTYPYSRRVQAWRYFADEQRKSSFGQFVKSVDGAQDSELAADFAASVQSWFSQATLRLVTDGIEMARFRGLQVDHIGLAGGAALNCQTNGLLGRRLAEFGVETMTISPWSDDAGTAVGAAVAVALEAGVQEFFCASAMLGPRPDPPSAALTDDDLELAVDALSAGDPIGLVSGAVEFGPRALGARCILASASIADSVSRLNALKGRPAFMPFAPAILERQAHLLFQGVASANMAWTVPALPGKIEAFPGIRHPTCESRVQAVTPSNAPLLHRLLEKISARQGVGIVLLTSLNGSGEAVSAWVDGGVNCARRLQLRGCLTDSGWRDFLREGS